MDEEEARQRLRAAERKADRKLDQEIAAGRLRRGDPAAKKRLKKLTRRFLNPGHDQ